MKKNLKIQLCRRSDIKNIFERINDFPNNLKENNIKKKILLRSLKKLYNQSKLYLIITDNIKVGFMIKNLRKHVSFLDFFSYSLKYLNISDLKKLKIIHPSKPLDRSYYLNKSIESHSLSNKKIEIKSERKKKILKILILGPNLRNINIKKKLISDGYKVDILNKKIDLKKIKNNNYDFLISSGYPFKINKKIVSNFRNKIINLHATFLPWGKGIGTTFFSFLLFQPLGLSIHYINKEFDMGNIICRFKFKENRNDTTRTLYSKLLKKLEKFFIQNSKKILENELITLSQKKQIFKPQYYSREEFEKIIRFLPNGYDTKLLDLIVHGLIIRENIKFINFLNSWK